MQVSMQHFCARLPRANLVTITWPDRQSAHTQSELLYLGARLRKYKTQLRLTSAVRTKWIGVGSQACLRARAEIGRRRPLPLDDCKVGHLEGVCQLAATLYKPGQAIAHVVVLHGDVRCQIQFELIIVSQL